MSDKYEFIDEEYATPATDTAPAPKVDLAVHLQVHGNGPFRQE